MKPGKTEVKKMMAVLDQDHDSLEAAAQAALEEAWGSYERKAQWITVGQLRWSKGFIDRDDEKASRVALGPFSTRKQAEAAGQSLAYSSPTGEQSAWVAAPMWYGTPAKWYADRKKKREALEAATDDGRPARELRRAHIEAWMETHPGEELPEHLQGNGWSGLDRFVEWHGANALQCPSCEGTGKIG